MYRLKETREKYQNILEMLRTDDLYFTEYLKFAGRSYKIPAVHTVSIFENNPSGTIFAEYGTWKKYGNSVKSGERSSAVLNENGAKLKHYFDINQTTAEIIPFQWSIDKEITEEFLKNETRQGDKDYRNLATYISTQSVKTVSENSENILSKFPVDEANRKAFLYSVSTMVMTMIAARCEYKSAYKYKTPNIPDLTALHMLKTKEDTIRLCDTVQQSAKTILLKMEKSITQIINIKQEEIKNGRNRDDEADRGMEQQAPRQQGGNSRSASRGREAGDDMVRGSAGVVSNVHNGGEGVRNDGIQAEQGRELHLQRSILGHNGGGRGDRVLRQEVAAVYGGELSRNGTDDEYQQLGLGDGIAEGGQGSGGAVSDIGREVPQGESTSHNLLGNSEVGENEEVGNRSRSNGTDSVAVSGGIKDSITEKTAAVSDEAAAVLRDTYSTLTAEEKRIENMRQAAKEQDISFSDRYSEGIDEPFDPYAADGSMSLEDFRKVQELAKVDEPHNFTITDPNLGIGGQKTKYQQNIEAIKTLKQIEAENRTATPEEQEILSKYTGWGGIPQAFDNLNDGWVKEYTELKELLTDEEYTAAKGSTLNAHYTTPTVINTIYKALDNMGFKQGNVLEPSMGVGNFFGCMPEKMRGSKLYGVELDSITGRIAKQLYPNADIQIKGFEKTNFPDNFFDVAIGNVPFGSYGVADRRYDKYNFLIHDYFFAKTLDKVAEGGIVAFVTSKGTLDKANPKAREYIARKANLLGAIRLPDNAFKGNANTEVTTDIIFLQKRKSPPAKMPDWVYLGETAEGVPVNQYFADNPEMVLGKMEFSTKMYGGKNTACTPFEGENLSEQLDKAVSNLKTNIAIKTRAEKQERAQGKIPATEDVRNFTHTVIDGKIFFRENDIMTEKFIQDKPVSGKYLKRILGMIELREKMRELIGAQAEGCSDEKLKELQADLNAKYDKFVKRNGHINDSANAAVFSEDDDYNTLCALEIIDPEAHTVTKSDIFTKRTVKPNVEISHVENPEEALQVSLDMRGSVDIPYMAELCGGSHQQVIDRLVSEGVIYLNPEKYKEQGIGAYEEASEYLSGNVRQKLRIAELAAEANPELFTRNVEKLKESIPPTIEAGEIKARLGVSWVEPRDYQRFLCEYAKASFHKEQLRRTYSGEYKVPRSGDTSIAATSTYGTKRITSYEIMERLLNNRDIIIKDAIHERDGSTHYVINNKETQLAKDKARLMQNAFQKWIWEEPQRRQKYVTKYNELFNSIVGRTYDGSHQTFPEMSPYIELNPHQKDAVARAKYGGNTLFAHCVGAGKSFEMVASVMEKKRLGLINKACVVVPKHLVGQTANEWLRLYPQAKLLVASEKDFDKNNRQKFIARCCTGDYAAVIMSYEQFEKINMSFEYRKRFMEREMEVLKRAIADTDSDDRGTVKDLEKAKKRLEERITKLLEGGKTKDTSLSFEQLGFDCLVVDEAHNYKNGLVVTKMSRVAGVQTTPAQKSEDILMKTQYLNETYGCKNIIFATGTPVTNSMTELYTMQRYLRPDLLKNAGLQNFDDWASNFGEVVTQLELKPAGDGYRPKKRFSKFVNLPELMQMYKEFADIRTADMLKLPVPEIEGGKPQTVVSKPNDFQKAYVQILAERSEEIHSGTVEPTEDNMLKVTNEARLLGLDARTINPNAENYPDSKVNMCIDNILKIYEETKEQKGVQAVFCDIAVNGDDGKFSVYDYLRSELVRRGIPADEICAAGDASNQKQRNEMYAQLRSGSKRIVLASTTKMGTGANVQTRLAAMHHLDIPWKPSDLEQRNGRIVRQGNTFDKVKIFNYVTEDTFDSYMLNIIINKQKFISQLMSGKTPARICEDVDEMVLNYSEMQSLATGDPRIKEKIELDGEVARLRTLESEHYNNKYRLEDFIVSGEKRKISLQNQLALCKADKEFAEKNKLPPDTFSVELGGKIYTERKDAAPVLQKNALDVTISGEPKKIGKYCGFDISVKRESNSFGNGFPVLFLQQGKNIQHSADLSLESDMGNITRMENILKLGIDKSINDTEVKLEKLENDLQEARQTKDTPFEFAAELEAKAARLEQLNCELNFDKPDEVVMLDENEEKDNPDLNEKLDNPKHKPKR
ncbi:MAG: DEAD/DEAH box helicase family protein [Eubacterium sp.]|nr:DEAD/DEAH box helicase family protein [Eubacterium sp.]